jgi:TonB-linked SusC/RagA family outer membrane protein
MLLKALCPRIPAGLTKTLMIMKFTAIIVLSACLTASANGYSQITLSVKNAPLQKVFKEIQKQSGYDFFYTYELLQQAGNVSVKVDKVPLEKALEESLRGKGLTYEIINKTVVIKEKAKEIIKKELIPTPIDVKGRVVNENGEPVAGASVKIKGTDIGTSTNENGEFTLNVSDSNMVLVISGTNIETVEVKINARTNLTFTVKTKISKLDEIQIVAYGTTTQRYNVGSVTKVTAEEIGKQPVSNPLAALQGRVAGLVVTSTSGIPGASFKLQIRGQNSLNPKVTSSLNIPLDIPLIIIDGVPYAPQNVNTNQFTSLASPQADLYNNPYGGMSPFNSINPADIESIEVLRDADATAIYGSRGANGVIIITTKKGKEGKARFSLNVYTGESRTTRTMALLNTQQYLAIRHEAFKNDGIIPNTNPSSTGYAKDLLIFDTTKYTDWKKQFYGGTSRTTDVNSSLTGGTVNTQFLVGAGYHHETYIFPGDFVSNRISVQANFRHSSTDKKFSLEMFSNYAYDENNSSGSPNALRANGLPPDYPDLLDGSGNLNWSYKGVDLFDNALAYLKQQYKSWNYNLISHLQIGYELFKNFTIQYSLGYSNYNGNEISKNPISAQDPLSTPISTAGFGTNYFQTWIIEPQAEYKRVFGKLKVNFLVGNTLQKNINSSTTAIGSGYSNEALLGSISAAAIVVNNDNYSEYKYAAIFGRFTSVFNNKYILSINGRRDGSSRFGPQKQYGNFGSIGAGWLFSEESILKEKFPILSYGKLRASFGTTGNDNIGNYQYLARWGTTSNFLSGLLFQGTNGYVPLNLYNPKFSWSTTRKLEASLELGFNKDRFISSITWYRNRCNNQLVSYSLPTQTGFPSVTANFPALVENKGWEIQVSSTNIKTKHFSWKTNFNISIPKNRLVSFPGIENTGYSSIYKVGQSLSVLNKYKLLGVNDTTGIYAFEDLNKDGTIDNLDFQVIGNLDPKYYGGIDNSFSYKQFELSIFIEYRKQTGANYLQQLYNFPAGAYGNIPVVLLDHWQKPGDHSNIERFSTRQSTLAGQAATKYSRSSGAYTDASFARFKTISLSYTLKNSFGKRKTVPIRFSVTAQNLFTITKFKGNDPETQSYYGVPPLKTIVAALQFTF